MERPHNKSSLAGLSLLERTDDELFYDWQELKSMLISIEGPIFQSPCLLTNSKDGRISNSGIKTFGYHLAAFSRYGRYNLERIPSTKTKNCLVISHICGNGPRCANPWHLCLESKEVNDERTHCHFSLSNIFEASGYEGTKVASSLGICPHTPRCLFLS